MHSCFRKCMNTIDLLIRLEAFVREAFIQKQHAVAVFFIWRRHTIQHGNMELCKIYSMQVLEDAYLSFFRASYRIDNSVWDLVTTNLICLIRRFVFHKAASCQLLCLHLSLTPGVECSLYVDDFLICYRSRYMHIIERHLQQTLNKLQTWVDTNGFQFSESKTVCALL